MKRLVLWWSVMFLLVSASSAQTLPNPIRTFLDSYYTTAEGGAWQEVPGACDEKKAVLTADFDGDGQPDYLVRFKTGKTVRSTRLHLVAFFNRNGEYTPEPFYEEAYTNELLRSTTLIIVKGTTVSLGLGAEGEGPNTVLKTDAVAQYICETDAGITFVYRDGAMKNIRDFNAAAAEDPTRASTAKPTAGLIDSIGKNPLKSNARPTSAVPNLNGNWQRTLADGTLSKTKLVVVQSGSSVTLQVDTDKVKGSIKAGKLFLDGVADGGTIEQNGSLIRWPDSVWMREGTVTKTLTVPVGQETFNLSGNWVRKPADGSVSDFKLSVIQSGTDFTLHINENKVTGSIKGNKFVVNGLDESGTIEQNGELIRWSDGVWVREGGSPAKLPNGSDIVGDNKTSGKQPILIGSIPGNTSMPPILSGTWTIFGADGKAVPDTVGKTSYDETTLVFEIKTTNSMRRATTYIENGKIHTGWNTTGTVSPDGNVITWSDGTRWKRK